MRRKRSCRRQRTTPSGGPFSAPMGPPFHFVKAAVTICTSANVASAASDLVSGVNDVIGACKGCGSPCDNLQDQIRELKAAADEVNALAGMAQAAWAAIKMPS